MSEQAIDKWARRYAERLMNCTPVIREEINELFNSDMRLSDVTETLLSDSLFNSVHVSMNCPLEGAEFRFMLAAIPHWLDVLENPRPERRPDPEPAPEWLREAVAKQVKVIKAITEEVKKAKKRGRK